MTIRKIAAVAALTLFAFPVAVQAQSGAAAGATTGAVGGAIVGGPVGAVVGGVGGAIVGGLADDQRPRFRQHVVQQRAAFISLSARGPGRRGSSVKWGHLLRGA